MNKLRNFLFILACTAALVSCTKDELEDPQTSAQPRAIVMEDLNNSNATPRSHRSNSARAVTLESDPTLAGDINDDGDDEDENINPE